MILRAEPARYTSATRSNEGATRATRDSLNREIFDAVSIPGKVFVLFPVCPPGCPRLAWQQRHAFPMQRGLGGVSASDRPITDQTPADPQPDSLPVTLCQAANNPDIPLEKRDQIQAKPGGGVQTGRLPVLYLAVGGTEGAGPFGSDQSEDYVRAMLMILNR